MGDAVTSTPGSSSAAAPYRLLTVCTGNICRSPMAETVLRAAVDRAGLGDRVVVSSAGTSDEELGNPLDSRARSVLTEAGYAVGDHRARQASATMVEGSDLVLAMTSRHAQILRRLAGSREVASRVAMYRSFDPDAPAVGRPGGEAALDIADPWYGDRDDFKVTLAQVEASVEGILAHVRSALGVPARRRPPS